MVTGTLKILVSLGLKHAKKLLKYVSLFAKCYRKEEEKEQQLFSPKTAPLGLSQIKGGPEKKDTLYMVG